jgi:hypothetical protein
MRLFWIALALAPTLLFGQGKVIFSKAPIDLNHPGPSVSSFQAGDPIYAAVILTAPVKSLCGAAISRNATKEMLELKHYVDNNFKDSGKVIVKGPYFAEATRIPMDVAPAPGRTAVYNDPNLEYQQFGNIIYGAMHWSRDLGALSGGTHAIRIEVEACSSPVASGEFKIAGPSFAHYAQLAPMLKGEMTKTVTMTAPKKKDAALEATMLRAMKASSSAAWKDAIIRTNIIDADWFLERHPVSGVILFRYIRAEVAVRGAGGCSIYRLVTFKQDYAGGQFRPVYYDGHGDKVQIPCENVMK